MVDTRYGAETDNGDRASVLTFQIGELTPEECLHVIDEEIRGMEKVGRGSGYTAVLLDNTAELCTAFILLSKDPIFLSDPESFIFPTRNGTCFIPTNWAEDVLKPAGARRRTFPTFPTIGFRGHATAVQHHIGVQDKPIQSQLPHSDAEITRNVYMQQVDPATWKAVVDLESKVDAQRKSKAAKA